MDIPQISALTNIPTAALESAYAGETRLTGEYARGLRNLYQRTTYADLRAAGYSATQARRYQWYGAPAVVSEIEHARDIVTRYADARLANYIDYQRRNGTYVSDQQAYQQLVDSIRASIQKSTLPPERLDEMIDAYVTNRTRGMGKRTRRNRR